MFLLCISLDLSTYKIPTRSTWTRPLLLRSPHPLPAHFDSRLPRRMVVSRTSSKRRLLSTTKTTWLLTGEERSSESLALEPRMSLILFVLCHEYIPLRHSPLRTSPLSIFPLLPVSSWLLFLLLFHFASLHLLSSKNNHVSLSLSLSLEYFLLLFQFFFLLLGFHLPSTISLSSLSCHSLLPALRLP